MRCRALVTRDVTEVCWLAGRFVQPLWRSLDPCHHVQLSWRHLQPIKAQQLRCKSALGQWETPCWTAPILSVRQPTLLLRAPLKSQAAVGHGCWLLWQQGGCLRQSCSCSALGNKADARLIMVPCRTLTARMCRAWFSKEAGRDSAGSWLRMRASRQLCALALGTLPAVLARAEMLPMSSLVRASGPAAALPSQHLLVPGAWDLAKHCRFADMLMDFIGQSKVQAMRRVNA